MIEFALIVPSLVLGGLLLFEKRDRSVERKEWALERIGLLQRIQAPQIEIAKHEAENEVADVPLYVSAEDDEEWDAYREAKKAGEVV